MKLFEHVDIVNAQSIQYTSPNQYELEAMCNTILSHPILEIYNNCISDAPQLANSVLPHAIFLSNYIPNIITKLGHEGCLFVSQSKIQYCSPELIEANEIKSVTGVIYLYIKSFVGTLVANLQKHRNGQDSLMLDMIQKSQLSSIRTLKSNHAVSPEIHHDLLV